MGCKSSHVASRIGAAWVALTLGTAGLGLTGCEIPPAREPATRPMPDKEQFLLSLVDRNFQDPEAQYQLGEYYHSERLWDKARYHLDLALRFAPAFRKAQVALVQMMLDKGDRQAADQVVNRFLRQVSGTPLEAVDLAKALASAGLDQYALTCFREATQVSPSSALVFKELGLYYFARNDLAQAKENLIHSFELNPNQPEVAGVLGQLGTVVEVPRAQTGSATQVPAQDPGAPQ